MKEVTFPIRVFKLLGISTLILSNVSGSTNAQINAGDIVAIKDHINLQPENPLRGKNLKSLGPRFPDMSNTYDQNLRNLVQTAAKKIGISVQEGVYVALAGPNLETPAEYNFINIIGGDLVGMSTVPEVIVARHMGISVVALSLVSNKCFPIELIGETTLESVIETANKAMPKLVKLVVTLLKEL